VVQATVHRAGLNERDAPGQSLDREAP